MNRRILVLEFAAGGCHCILDRVAVRKAVPALGLVHRADFFQEMVRLPGVAGGDIVMTRAGQVPGDTMGHIGGQDQVALQQTVAEGVALE